MPLFRIVSGAISNELALPFLVGIICVSVHINLYFLSFYSFTLIHFLICVSVYSNFLFFPFYSFYSLYYFIWILWCDSNNDEIRLYWWQSF